MNSIAQPVQVSGALTQLQEGWHALIIALINRGRMSADKSTHFSSSSVATRTWRFRSSLSLALVSGCCRSCIPESSCLSVLGFLCIRYPEMMLDTEAKELYLSSLRSNAPLKMKCQVMKNLQTHLLEVESTLQQANADRTHTTHDINLHTSKDSPSKLQEVDLWRRRRVSWS